MIKKLVDKLQREKILSVDEFKKILETEDVKSIGYLHEKSRDTSHSIYGRDIYIRGLIEFTNYCKNNCLYCGIRHNNNNIERYRLTKEEILNCTDIGYSLGFRTFVLQGGEDPYFSTDKIVDIVSSIKSSHPDCAITLSIGEKSYESYKAFFDAGADRYLLRHETANKNHYSKIHPKSMSLKKRQQCLWDLKEIGYQVGCGFMVGSPYQTLDNIVEDLLFIKELNPHMIGIGPFIPHKDTPFKNHSPGTIDLTLKLLSIIRLMLPNVLLPSTTALATIDPCGRERGILVGANVVMPNLSPESVREKYTLYNNKACSKEESAEYKFNLEHSIKYIGYNLIVNRGDYKII